MRAHWPGGCDDPALLWQTYIQLTEAAFRTMKSEHSIRPIRHKLQPRVEALMMIAFLSCAMHVCLKKLAAPKAHSLTPWQTLEHLRKIVLVDVGFGTRDGSLLTLPHITIPEKEQAALLMQLCWILPSQPPSRIRARQVPDSEK